MATLNITNNFTNGTAANATEVNQNFTDVKTFVESSLVQADGTVQAGTAAIAAGAVTEAKLASALIQLLTPTGSISQYGGASAPTGWLICDGSELPIASYTALYNVLTTTGTVFPYGANTNGSGGAGSTHFRVPNLKGRVAVGRDSSQTEFDVLGETGGAKTHTLTTSEMPSHGHSVSVNNAGSHSHTVDGGAHAHTLPARESSNTNAHSHSGSRLAESPSNGSTNDEISTTNGAYGDGSHSHNVSTVGDHGHTVNQSNAGSDAAHNNLQPYIVLNYIIKH
jgi:microcystin-dependent protein